MEPRWLLTGNLLITELLANNTDGLTDEDHDHSPWVEIHNSDTIDRDLSGWHLTDDQSDPVKWTFPSGTTLGAGQFLVVFASGKDRAVSGGILHTSFTLDAAGGYLGLTDDSLIPRHEYAPYPALDEDTSFGIGMPGPRVPTTVSLVPEYDLWIRESFPDTVYENDAMWVAATDLTGENRWGVAEWDLGAVTGEIVAAHMEFNPRGQSHGNVVQQAFSIDPGIAALTYERYLAEKAATEQPLEGLGAITTPSEGIPQGTYAEGDSASSADLDLLNTLRTTTETLAVSFKASNLALQWNDGANLGGTGLGSDLPVRLVVETIPLPLDQDDVRFFADPTPSGLNVGGVSDSPVADDDNYAMDEDGTLVVEASNGVLSNDIDVDSPNLTAIAVSEPSHGSLMFSPDGSFTYVPDEDYSGSDQFTYRADDRVSSSNLATVTITINPFDDAPLAADDAYTVLEDTVLVTEDSEAVEQPPTPPPAAVPWRGEEGGNGNHYLIVRPPGGVTWAEARSGAEQLGGHLVTITSAAESNFLAANLPIGGGWIGGLQDRSSPSYAEPTGGWSWITGEPWSYTNWQSGEPNNSNGVEDYLQVDLNSGVRWNDISEARRAFYIAEFETGEVVDTVPLVSRGSIWSYLDDGSDQGTFWRSPGFDDSGWRQGRAQLGYGDNDEITVVGYGPDGADKFATTYFRHQFVIDDVSAVDELSAQLMRDDGAAVYVNGVEVFRDGNLPAAAPFDAYTSYEGSDNAEVPFQIDPGLLVDGENTVAVEVHQFRPTSSDVSFDLSLVATLLSQPAMPGVLANDRDVDGDVLTVQLVSGPSSGHLTLDPNGSFTYAPHPDFFGTDSFTYRVSDETGLTDTASVTISVHAVNDAPQAVDDSYLLVANEAIVIDAQSGVLANDSDAEGTSLMVRLVEPPESGTLALAVDGSFEYTPGETFTVSDRFTYVADDGLAESEVAVVTILADIPTIMVGDHSVLPDSPDQIVEVLVTGGHEVTGVNIRAQIGDGTGAGAEPVFQAVDFAGGIWDVATTNGGGGPVAGARQFAQANVQFSASGMTTAADGRLVRLIVDTTGLSEGTFDLLLRGTEIGVDTDFVGSPAHIVNGTVTIANSRVVGRHVFYNESYFDGDDAEVNEADDSAIASDKRALLPGEGANFANYTSHWSGITGIMIDVEDLTGEPTADDFRFRVGNDDDPENWLAAPAPSNVVVRSAAGTDGSDRIVIAWPEHAIENQWLQVTMLATGTTGLRAPDVFYFGNAVGEAGDSDTVAFVDGTDFALARDNPRNFLDRAPVDFPYDYNRDSFVDGFDLAIARDNGTNFLTALKLITVPGASSESPPNNGFAIIVQPSSESELVAEEVSRPEVESAAEVVGLAVRQMFARRELDFGSSHEIDQESQSLEEVLSLIAADWSQWRREGACVRFVRDFSPC